MEDRVYLQPSRLCDFDRSPDLRNRAFQLAGGKGLTTVDDISHFVRGLLYGLDDWDVPASRVLAKGWGMCSGKTLLWVALLRCVGIPARFKVVRIRAEEALRHWMLELDPGLAPVIEKLPDEQDHVVGEAWVEGSWVEYDVSRDPALEAGMVALGIPLEREMLSEGEIMADFDSWAIPRQKRITVVDRRKEAFRRMNRCFHLIRERAGTWSVPKEFSCYY